MESYQKIWFEFSEAEDDENQTDVEIFFQEIKTDETEGLYVSDMACGLKFRILHRLDKKPEDESISVMMESLVDTELMEKLERVGYEFFYEDSSGSEPRDEIWR